MPGTIVLRIWEPPKDERKTHISVGHASIELIAMEPDVPGEYISFFPANSPGVRGVIGVEGEFHSLTEDLEIYGGEPEHRYVLCCARIDKALEKARSIKADTAYWQLLASVPVCKLRKCSNCVQTTIDVLAAAEIKVSTLCGYRTIPSVYAETCARTAFDENRTQLYDMSEKIRSLNSNLVELGQKRRRINLEVREFLEQHDRGVLVRESLSSHDVLQTLEEREPTLAERIDNFFGGKLQYVEAALAHNRRSSEALVFWDIFSKIEGESVIAHEARVVALNQAFIRMQAARDHHQRMIALQDRPRVEEGTLGRYSSSTRNGVFQDGGRQIAVVPTSAIATKIAYALTSKAVLLPVAKAAIVASLCYGAWNLFKAYRDYVPEPPRDPEPNNLMTAAYANYINKLALYGLQHINAGDFIRGCFKLKSAGDLVREKQLFDNAISFYSFAIYAAQLAAEPETILLLQQDLNSCRPAEPMSIRSRFWRFWGYPPEQEEMEPIALVDEFKLLTPTEYGCSLFILK